MRAKTVVNTDHRHGSIGTSRIGQKVFVMYRFSDLKECNPCKNFFLNLLFSIFKDSFV